MSIYVCGFLIGVVAGLRAFTAPAAISWGARLGWLHLENTGLAFLGSAITPYIVSAVAIAELINDKLPTAPSRKAPGGFGARIVTGSLCGAALGMPAGVWIGGLVAGAIGAIAGTLGGYEARTRLVKATGGKDLPIALLEDVIAIGSAVWIAGGFS